jgi:prephenate dehydrogenase
VSGGGEPAPFSSVGVIGCGLIGGSFACAAAALPGVDRVVATDADPQVRDVAAGLAPMEVVADAATVAARADLLVIAVPVEHIPAVVGQAGPSLAPEAVVTDVGSTKARLVPAVLDALGQERSGRYVGGHPMAGSESSGLAAADPALFQGATWVLTPTARTDHDAFNRLGVFLRMLGARVLAVEPTTHDRLVAVTSHLPQLIASALMRNTAALAEREPGLLAMAGGGFRDVTRLAGSDPDLWSGIIRENRESVAEALEAFRDAVDEMAHAVAGQDWEHVRTVLVEGRAGRRALPSKLVPDEVVDLVVPVADRPGALAEVATALGAAGLNIEDLSMRHAETGARGALVVAVAGHDVAARAREVVVGRGFHAWLEPR